jgi:hypothetical protein
VSFIAENPHLIESKDRESSMIQTEVFWVHIGRFCALEKREVQKIVSPVYWELVVNQADRCTGNRW